MCRCNIPTGDLQEQPFADILQNRCPEKCSQENTCVGISFLIKLQALDLQLYFEKTPI